MDEGHWTHPKWMYRQEKPPSDDAYFENMTRVIFIAGLKWKVIDRKWPNFTKAFKNFSIEEVANFDDANVRRLLEDTGIVRNRAKIVAAVQNAAQFKTIKAEYGSFRKYLNSLDKSDNYSSVIKDLSKRFKRLGSASARIFLYSVGEKIKPVE